MPQQEEDDRVQEDDHELQKGPGAVLCVAEHGPPGLDVDQAGGTRPASAGPNAGNGSAPPPTVRIP